MTYVNFRHIYEFRAVLFWFMRACIARSGNSTGSFNFLSYCRSFDLPGGGSMITTSFAQVDTAGIAIHPVVNTLYGLRSEGCSMH